jgi:hypothetical protein
MSHEPSRTMAVSRRPHRKGCETCRFPVKSLIPVGFFRDVASVVVNMAEETEISDGGIHRLR